MQRNELRQIASLAANHCFVRYWFDYCQVDGQNYMAIAFMDWGGIPASVYEGDLLTRGFKRREDVLHTPNVFDFPFYLIAETTPEPTATSIVQLPQEQSAQADTTHGQD